MGRGARAGKGRWGSVSPGTRDDAEGGRWEGTLTPAHGTSSARGRGKQDPDPEVFLGASQSRLCASAPDPGSHGNGDSTAAARGQAPPRFQPRRNRKEGPREAGLVA